MKKRMFFLLALWLLIVLMSIPTHAQNRVPRGEAEGSGSGGLSAGVDSGVSPDDPNLSLKDSANSVTALDSSSCTWWWIYGKNSWSWKRLFVTSYKSSGQSSTEYGTSSGGCGIPLVVDTIYVRVTEYPLNTPPYTTYDATATNTNFVSRNNSGTAVLVPPICGVNSFHSFSKSGTGWSVTVRSGCA